jgi:hypothetical protein
LRRIRQHSVEVAYIVENDTMTGDAAPLRGLTHSRL